MALALEAKELHAMLREMKPRAQTIDDHFRELMIPRGAAMATYRSVPYVRLQPGGRTGIDVDLLRLRYPDIADECTKQLKWWTPKYD